jgi:hypothetical protein
VTRSVEDRPSGEGTPCPGLPSWRWNATALAVFAAAFVLVFGPVLRAGPRSFVPTAGLADPQVQAQSHIDVTFHAWLVARNARTLAREPWRLFDAEHCAPGEKTLTLGVPTITMGLLAVPALITGDPILCYNFAILAVLGVAALAMYLLVAEWTGIPVAGIAAALLFAFHPVRIDRIFYVSDWDGSWTVLALLFSRRLFAHGRWRDAVGLTLAGALQIAAHFYPTLAAVLLAIPFAVWLAAAYGLRNARPAQLAFVSLGVALAAAIVLGPYQAASAAAPGHFERGYQFYAPWQMYLPGTWFFPGWLELGLVAAGLALPRRLGLPALAGRDPRFALAAGALLVSVIAAGRLGDSILAPLAGGFAGVNPYEILASVLPGLDMVRAVERLAGGVLLALAILAGVGAAACVRLAGRRAAPVGALVVVLVALEVLALPHLGRETPRLRIDAIRPAPELLAFYAELEARGNRGPIVELPFESGLGLFWAPKRILASAWHHRRTSSCYASYTLPGREELAALVARLPEADAVRGLAALGFTTIVVHDPKGAFGSGWALRLARGTGRREARLRPLHETRAASAFAIEVAGSDRPAVADP